MADETPTANQAKRHQQLFEVFTQTYERTSTIMLADQTTANRNIVRVAYHMRGIIAYGECAKQEHRNGIYMDGEHDTTTAAHGLANGKFAIAAENKRLIEYEDPKTQRLRTLKPAAFVKMLNHKLAIGFDTETLDRYATYLGEEMPNATPFVYEIVGGKEATRIYNETIRTCMTGSVSLKFYEENDPNIQIVRIKRHGTTFGRAVLWSLHDGRKYLDRIYPSSGNHIYDLSDYAEKQGWVVRPTHGADVNGGQRQSLDNQSIVTVPLIAPDDNRRSAHSMGGFPYMDTFRYMKHSPDKTEVMLRPDHKRGWVMVGDSRHNYANMRYCPLLRGWSDSFVTAVVADDDLNIMEERAFDGPNLRHTHRLVRFPKDTMPPGVFRVFVNEKFADEIVTDGVGGQFLRRHGIEMPDGKVVFRDDTLEMHDGSYIEAQGQLRYVARLPNGKFIFRRDARYDQERREWVPKED